ncbi:ABC transporter ATP-binding protein/permease [Gallibacter intestinalis]|uniref:ABC transporter ATP-binding protein/permease n=1 Tax=Gallibacter intestinalis TaxID=2779356 RepID=A0ABR9QWG1_9FIRM|nr:ABC transporter ATP-binding protein/permease [Gallibacter intestinalis]MBE5035214.1 ABC transporter ATP-binding protein/permease [Gallibacter intestinalis]
MIKRELIRFMKGAGKYIVAGVWWQWAALLCQIVVVFVLAIIIQGTWQGNIRTEQILWMIAVAVAFMIAKAVCDRLSAGVSYQASEEVKLRLRGKIFEKILALGTSYRDKTSTAELLQLSVEGVEQLEIYYGRYLPQLFYSLLAPLTLFVVLSQVSLKSAAILLVCVPLIPISIVLVQKIAKKLLKKYWGVYTQLGDSFLENLQGLTTLKIYKSDGYASDKMDREAENFRKITMRVLVMQLNSISVMDIVAYAGAGAGIICALLQFSAGNLQLAEMIIIVLLAAEFFIPLRLLGSFFHIAMNGMAASDKIFAFLKTDTEKNCGTQNIEGSVDITIRNLGFAYDKDRKILDGVSMDIHSGQFVSLVGLSGSGKSTIAALIAGKFSGYEGDIKISGKDLNDISEVSLMDSIVTVGYNSFIFGGSVRENLTMAKKDASESEMISVLQKVKLWDFLQKENGLDTKITEQGSNLSGGQRQRLALARALLKDAEMYIFDEASSNIDVESEKVIMDMIKNLAKSKTVLSISHRMANAVDSDVIYVIENGKIIEKGNHLSLLKDKGRYAEIYTKQEKMCAKWENSDEKKQY